MKKNLSSMKIGTKLPVLIGVLVAVTIAVMAIVNAFMTADIITKAANEKLESISVLKKKRTDNLLNAIDRDLRLKAQAPFTSQALIALTDGYSSLEAPQEVLTRVYITENEYPAGEKDKLVSADTGSSYGFIHAIYHPTLDQLQNEMQYYDIFLIDPEGNLVYSVFKSADFATNLNTGPWKDSGLAEVFRQASALSPTDPSAFVDFEPYAPSEFAPAAFVARPVFNEQGERLGVLAYQMPINQLNIAAGDLEGLGASADGFIVGSDRLLRTDSRATAANDILTTVAENAAINDGLAGGTGMFEGYGFDDQGVLGYYLPVDFLGTRWVTIVQQDKSELFAGLYATLYRSIAIAVCILLSVMAISVFFSRGISVPVRDLAKAVKKVADGDLEIEIPGTKRGDEIGELARTTEIFRQNSMRIEKMSREQEAANSKMEELNAEREKAAQDALNAAKEKERADAEAQEAREQMMNELKTSFGDVVAAAVSGNFTKRVEKQFDDQILDGLSHDINDLLETVEHGLTETGRVLQRVSEGDLTQVMEGDFAGSFDELKQNVNQTTHALTALVGNISESGQTLSASSGELRQTADGLSRQAEQNAASVEETSAALEQLSASIVQVNHNIETVSANATEAKKTASDSGRVAENAAASMEKISEGSKEISRVTAVINDIAFQINLLALNAGVEAARAGESGRGFSVVASEVRQLAQRAAEAAREIAEVIQKSDVAVSEGVENVANAKASLNEIATSVVKVSDGVAEVTTAMSEQSAGIKEISSAVAQVDSNTQKQAAAFEELTASSHLLSKEADELRDATKQFKVSGQQTVVEFERKATVEQDLRKEEIAVVNGPSLPLQDTSDGWDEF